jgi:glycosyltransferase involved in cell wall biosynthesis
MSGSFVLVTSSFPIRGDGSEAAGSFVADLVKELAKDVHVRVVAPGAAGGREQWSDGVEVYRYSAPLQPLSTLRPWRPGDLRWIGKVWREGASTTCAAAEGASHLLALWGLPCGEWARRAAQESGTGYSVWMLGSDVWTLGRLPIVRGMLARVIRQAAHAYADGLQLAEDAQRISGIPVAFLPSTRKIQSGNRPRSRTRAPYRFLFLGRWHLNKGVDLLLEALAMLNDSDWRNIECVEIHGGGPLESLVHARGEQLRSAGRPVEVGRFLAKEDAEAAIARADWVLIPSRIESIPVVFSDAMKLGRPVVATPVGDLPRLLAEYHCGVLCPAASAGGLVQGIRDAAQGTTQIAPQALNAAAQIFSLSGIAQRLLEYAR